MDIYKSKVSFYTDELSRINSKYNLISLLRLISVALFFTFLYYYFQNTGVLCLLLAVLFFAAFIFLMRIHSKLQFKKKINQALLDINKNEIDFLERKAIPFENGAEFIDFHHSYAYDLDIFGNNSLFQYLNRTATYIGKKILADGLLHKSLNEEIQKNQEAIKELTQKIAFRQEFLALAKVTEDKESSYQSLLDWSRFNRESLPNWTLVFAYVSPVLFLMTSVIYGFTSNMIILKSLSYLFLINLMVLGRFIKRIQLEIANSDNIDKIIGKYGLLLEKIENTIFASAKLKVLQQRLQLKKEPASVHLKQLSELFSRNDTIANLVTAVVFNGTFLFNFHVLKALLAWKKEHAADLEDWLDVIGEFEKLNSLANFSYNNPDFVFPSINSEYKIGFTNLGHPLLNPKTRVGNDTYFYPQSFMILTGSNMSGKSTFLRSLGINMVLTGTGSVVCAAQADVHPLPVLVSMRLSDSLSDSESYFFAEIKRLKQIMDGLAIEPAFVLLDEILRGTNSDDKRNGTIEVLKKVIAKKALGAIATHDIEVCLTTNEFPEILTNNCFEVEIKENDLHFDYKLRKGICQNKSATFLMKKMEII
ncbi:MutS domain V [Flavobacterium glycines]|uniref:DNA mismatch repair protein n=1 Tax=Flavobacterium glycines TaxID=551990 RepID=A0A1B9DZB4_9FLAO|nr:DNA mismatch repair protein [Flavobacterium glycines]OCB75026.1 DNA mismatch repair protein [Flavobacterium glycines]GEL11323.1 DNA mismatch repair protein MutS [Flavobacterium glycines]SDJ41771.1 MutS domain V [Flavobacterium glycines]